MLMIIIIIMGRECKRGTGWGGNQWEERRERGGYLG
jgi:hypothetical protein